jgi:murein L,D-transpeptidase YafK
MTVFEGEQPTRTFRVAVGRRYGAKAAQGDGRTPEGLYYIDAFKADSQFYRALKISYPNEADRARAAELGVAPGGLIMIHGLDSNIEAMWQERHWMFNWTDGCVAVTNAEMDLLWESVALGTPIEIRA